MAFADPQSVTINAVANSLPRTRSEGRLGEFTKDDRTVRLLVSHNEGKRIRRTIRLEHSKITADPLVPTSNQRVGMTAYLVVDLPPTGYTVAEAKQVVDGLTAYLTASTGARVTQLLGGEN